MKRLLIEKRFLINELASQANTTVRTIRYYTSEGLLPQPDTDGKYAYYGENHLHRLELILQLKEAFLPLKEIRLIMLSIDDEEVIRRLKEGTHQLKIDDLDEKSKKSKEWKQSSAIDYISNLMETQSKYRSTIYQSRQSIPGKEPDLFSQNSPFIDPQDLETWQRIILAPGVEMHLRYPVDGETARRIQDLIMFAKKIFYKH